MNRNKLALLSGLVLLATTQFVQAQANNKMVLLGLDLYKGVGTYTAITYGAGLSAAYHKPLEKNLVFTAKAGVSFYKAELYSIGSGFGYTGNPTTMYPGQFYSTFDETSITGIALPISAGLRQYLPTIVKGAHADVGIGARVGVSKFSTSFLFTPSVGYMLPLPGGNYLDFTLLLQTKLARGGTVIGLGVALGLPR